MLCTIHAKIYLSLSSSFPIVRGEVLPQLLTASSDSLLHPPLSLVFFFQSSSSPAFHNRKNLIFIQLYEYFNTNNLLYKSQYGFRPKHSAELAALEIVDKIIYQLDNSETPISLFLDISKAFDLHDHNIILYKLNYYNKTIKKNYIEFENLKTQIRHEKHYLRCAARLHSWSVILHYGYKRHSTSS